MAQFILESGSKGKCRGMALKNGQKAINLRGKFGCVKIRFY